MDKTALPLRGKGVDARGGGGGAGEISRSGVRDVDEVESEERKVEKLGRMVEGVFEGMDPWLDEAEFGESIEDAPAPQARPGPGCFFFNSQSRLLRAAGPTLLPHRQDSVPAFFLHHRQNPLSGAFLCQHTCVCVRARLDPGACQTLNPEPSTPLPSTLTPASKTGCTLNPEPSTPLPRTLNPEP